MFEDILAVKAALLHGFAGQRVLVVGDVMLDKYLWGDATRISPEAPVPVVRLTHRTFSLGGAANVAHNLAALGVQVELAGFVGSDADAELLRGECTARGIGTVGLTNLDDFCTTAKTRVLADSRQLLRLDEEVTQPRPNEDADRLLHAIETVLVAQTGTPQTGDTAPTGGASPTDSAAQPLGAVILSDYAKGLCTPYLCQQLIARCRALGIPLYVDPKGRDYLKYRGATAIKPNRPEMSEVASVYGWDGADPVVAARHLLEMTEADFVAVTLGAQGMAVVQRDGTHHQMPTVAREVFDVSGAGDTVIATLVAGLCSGLPLLESATLANVAAAEVISHIGSRPIGREELLVAAQAQNRATSFRKLYSLEELQTVVAAWRAQGLRVALTNGCFDLLHAGHVRLLEDSAAQAERLIIALNDDASIRRLKGEGRPLMNEAQRVAVLSALECVDAVVVFGEDTPLQVVAAVRPHLLLKGDDYSVEDVVGGDLVQSYGGQVVLVPMMPDVSTSRLLNKIDEL